jgi:formylglycine-generating enzyme required for sulfatase activity
MMGAYEVTQGQWKAVMGDNPSVPEQGDDLPVSNVSRGDAVAFAEQLSRREGKKYRLPTEAEWEYACRAGARTAFQWADDPGAGKGWCNGADITFKESNPVRPPPTFNWVDGYVNTSPVGVFKPNAWGLYDMHGNVVEWCSDWYDEYPPGDAVDPRGPTGPPAGRNPPLGVLRGGVFNAPPRNCRAAYRRTDTPALRSSSLGFRACLEVE